MGYAWPGELGSRGPVLSDNKDARVERMEQLVTDLALGAGRDLDDIREDGVIV